MQVQESELLFIYNSNSLQERRAFGYAKSSGKYVVKSLDLDKDNLTERQVVEIAQRLKIPLDDLLNNDAGNDLISEDIPTYLVQNPTFLRTPIVLYHDGGEFVDSSFEFIKRK